LHDVPGINPRRKDRFLHGITYGINATVTIRVWSHFVGTSGTPPIFRARHVEL